MTTPKLEEEKLSLRVLIDPKNNKLLFAEADSDFVDVLFSFMTIPLGTIVRLADKHFGSQKEVMGSLKTLKNGIKNLSSSCFCTPEAKLMLLNPRNSTETECRKLKLNIDDSEPTKYFACENLKCSTESENTVYVSTYNVGRCHCGRFMNREIGLHFSDVEADSSKNGVFTPGGASFIIRDDLHVLPNLLGSSIELLNSLGYKDMTKLEEKTFILGLNEIISLLMWSMVSMTPLSDVILHNKPLKSETFCSAMSQTSNDTTTNSRKMAVKLMIHKSTQKLLFAQADNHFVEFLFSLLTIPLGSVVSLLSNNTSLGGIVNLYNSISCLTAYKYLKSDEVRSMLISPKLPPHYLSRMFAIGDQTYSYKLFYHCLFDRSKNFNDFLSHHEHNGLMSSYEEVIIHGVTLTNPKGVSGYLRWPAMFMVTDDLEVTPFSSISTIFFFNKLGISHSDVEELVLEIGMEEAVGILRASLNSSSALTNGLNLTSMKQPKQEK